MCTFILCIHKINLSITCQSVPGVSVEVDERCAIVRLGAPLAS